MVKLAISQLIAMILAQQGNRVHRSAKKNNSASEDG
jgi:hypothetical protein